MDSVNRSRGRSQEPSSSVVQKPAAQTTSTSPTLRNAQAVSPQPAPRRGAAESPQGRNADLRDAVAVPAKPGFITSLQFKWMGIPKSQAATLAMAKATPDDVKKFLTLRGSTPKIAAELAEFAIKQGVSFRDATRFRERGFNDHEITHLIRSQVTTSDVRGLHGLKPVVIVTLAVDAHLHRVDINQWAVFTHSGAYTAEAHKLLAKYSGQDARDLVYARLDVREVKNLMTLGFNAAQIVHYRAETLGTPELAQALAKEPYKFSTEGIMKFADSRGTMESLSEIQKQGHNMEDVLALLNDNCHVDDAIALLSARAADEE